MAASAESGRREDALIAGEIAREGLGGGSDERRRERGREGEEAAREAGGFKAHGALFGITSDLAPPRHDKVAAPHLKLKLAWPIDSFDESSHIISYHIFLPGSHIGHGVTSRSLRHVPALSDARQITTNDLPYIVGGRDDTRRKDGNGTVSSSSSSSQSPAGAMKMKRERRRQRQRQ
jgi:hypothetical protein